MHFRIYLFYCFISCIRKKDWNGIGFRFLFNLIELGKPSATYLFLQWKETLLEAFETKCWTGMEFNSHSDQKVNGNICWWKKIPCLHTGLRKLSFLLAFDSLNICVDYYIASTRFLIRKKIIELPFFISTISHII